MFFSNCHRDIGIPINFQEESGIVIPLEVKQGNRPSSQDYLGYMELFRVAAVTSEFL